MSQNSLVLPTTGTVSGLQVVQSVNQGLDTLNTLASGASAPPSPEAGQLWHDTTNNLLKILSLDGSTWIPLFILSESQYTATPYASGKATNRVRNADMSVAQRGASGTITGGAGFSYTLDGMMLSSTGGNLAWAQGGTIGGLAGRSLQITGATGVTAAALKQRIESLQSAPLAGNVTVSLLISNQTGAALTPTLTVRHPTAVDNYASTVTDVNGVSLQSVAGSGVSRVAYTFASGAAYNGMEVEIDFGGALSSGSKYVSVSEFSVFSTPNLPVGLNGNPPICDLPNAEASLAECQRHFQRLGGETTDDVIALGFIGTPPAANVFLPVLPVRMRAAPTASIGNGGNFRINSPNNINTLTGFTASSAASFGAVSIAVTFSGTNVAGLPCTLSCNTTSDYLALSAEL